ncbi:MAG TPA: aminoacyl-tRNA hydrolase [Acidimicrobiales bacterium]|nr:aminoacyl-tRNA hydrolase [Acidimicrobiales bacterium]
MGNNGSERPSVTGHQDPPGEAPWAMQMVARVDKEEPPALAGLLEAAGAAVVTLLADGRSDGDGPWADEVDRWLSGRIRKVVRRARGSAWERVQEVPGVTVERRGAEVRALVPGPTDAVPAEVRKLQLSGFVTSDDELPSMLSPPRRWPGLVVAVNPGLELSPGKLAAQVAHATNLAWMQMGRRRLDAWEESGFVIAVCRPDERRWRAFVTGAPVVVADAGFTEVAPGTQTTAAYWD